MKFFSFIFCLALIGFGGQLNAQCGSKSAATNASYSPPSDIIEIATSSDDFATLTAAVKAAGLVGTLQSEGPFTVFAPTNSAFAKLPEGTVETLLKPENKEALTKVLTYHVVAGEFKAADVVQAIKSSNGNFKIKTVSGGTLIASLQDGNVVLTDENGGKAAVVQTDVDASNGVVHVIDTVVLPK